MRMNESDIDRAVEILDRHAPAIGPYAHYLSDWRHVVNSNSDGWPYWRAGTRCTDTLAKLLDNALDAVRSGDDSLMPSEKALRTSLAPIKAMATRSKLQAPTLAEPPAAPAP